MAAKYPPPDTQTANHAVQTLAEWDKDPGVGNFFMAVGFHKPHLPFVCPQKYFDLYPESVINLPKNPDPPVDMPAVSFSVCVCVCVCVCGFVWLDYLSILRRGE